MFTKEKLKKFFKNEFLPIYGTACIVVSAGVFLYYNRKNLIELNDKGMEALRNGEYFLIKMENGKLFGKTFSE